MPKQECIEQDGRVEQVLPNGLFRVKLLENEKYQILAHPSGKMQKNKIKIIQGDTVRVAVTPYDLAKGRIIYRYK